MMGFQEAPARLFYDFYLDEHVPSDHLLRGVDRHLDLDDLRQSLMPFYSQMGRPSVDPELMIRMLIVGYCMGIRSEGAVKAMRGSHMRRNVGSRAAIYAARRATPPTWPSVSACRLAS
jgi:transposase